MSAFGRKNGLGGKSSFGVASPMQAPGASPQAVSSSVSLPAGGSQFPPIPADPGMGSGPMAGLDRNADAMSRLTERMNSEHIATDHSQGFEASVHKIRCCRACSSASTRKRRRR